jgi:hypothetical protein
MVKISAIYQDYVHISHFRSNDTTHNFSFVDISVRKVPILLCLGGATRLCRDFFSNGDYHKNYSTLFRHSWTQQCESYFLIPTQPKVHQPSAAYTVSHLQIQAGFAQLAGLADSIHQKTVALELFDYPLLKRR